MPKRTKRNKCNKIFLFNQTLKDIEHVYRCVSGYDEFEELCTKSWVEDYIYLCFDRCKKKRSRQRYCIYNESEISYTECTPETNPF